MRQQHVRDDVYPADAAVGEIRRRGVKAGEKLGQAVVTHEIYHAETAVEEEQDKRQHRRAASVDYLAAEEPAPAENLSQRKDHRHDVRRAQRQTEQVQARRHAVAQEGIAQARAGQDAVFKREVSLFGHRCDEAEVHTHVAVAALAAVKPAAVGAEGVGAQQVHAQREKRRQQEYERPVAARLVRVRRERRFPVQPEGESRYYKPAAKPREVCAAREAHEKRKWDRRPH